MIDRESLLEAELEYQRFHFLIPSCCFIKKKIFLKVRKGLLISISILIHAPTQECPSLYLVRQKMLRKYMKKMFVNIWLTI